jgi:hypothetical protein
LESGYEKDPRDHEGLLGALHEQEPQALLDRKVILESRGFQVLQRTQELQARQDLKEIQGQKAILDQLANKVIRDSKGQSVLKVVLGNKDLRDCQAHRAVPDTRGRQESKGQEEIQASRVILVKREIQEA